MASLLFIMLGVHEFRTERRQGMVTAHTKLVIGNTNKITMKHSRLELHYILFLLPYFLIASIALDNRCTGQGRTRIIAARAFRS
jgi:hypothetical protein